MNRLVRLRLIIIFFLSLAMVFCSQAAENNDQKRTFHIAVLYWSMDIPGQVIMREGVEHAASLVNQQSAKNSLAAIKLYPFVAGNGEEGIERQILQFDRLVDQQEMDLIIVQPTDNAALAKGLIKANQKNIPVVAYDQYISGGQLASFITSDNYQAGYLDGEYIASKFEDDYSFQLILVDYPYVSSTVDRVDGFLDALAENQQDYNIVKTYQAVIPSEGKKAAKQILLDFPIKKSIDVIFTVNDGAGLSVVRGLSDAGRDEIMIATIDGDPLSVKNITDNRLTVINSAQFCKPLGEETLYTAYAILNGKTVAKHKLIPVYPVAQETLSAYPGWSGPIPPKFKKQWPAQDPFWHGPISASQY
jgi:ribose transport system substrate-binding protein